MKKIPTHSMNFFTDLGRCVVGTDMQTTETTPTTELPSEGSNQTLDDKRLKFTSFIRSLYTVYLKGDGEEGIQI